jgi:hypothetical protein
MSSKDNLVIFSIKLDIIVLKVYIILDKKPLEGFFISLIKAKLIYFIGLSLLDKVELYNLLLELFNLVHHLLGSNIKGSRGLAIITNTRGG